IDRFSDPEIRDLNGATRDAQGLWALFADTIPALTAELLVDQDATRERVLKALDTTLGAAGPQDIVIITFSTHGTRDHRLVVHDTEYANLPASTIEMSEIASRFYSSRAGLVLCVLDCCFSGGAPARVLEESVASRDPGDPVAELVGTGRVIITACAKNQLALE